MNPMNALANKRLSPCTARRRKNIHITSDWHLGRVPVSSKVCCRLSHVGIFLNQITTGQWTPQAQNLYDLLIATFSNDRDGLADLGALQKNSGLDPTEWEDLLQYTAQVHLLPNSLSCHRQS